MYDRPFIVKGTTRTTVSPKCNVLIGKAVFVKRGPLVGKIAFIKKELDNKFYTALINGGEVKLHPSEFILYRRSPRR